MTREFKFKADWLLWFLILLPTFYIVGKDLRHVQISFFQVAVIVMLGLYHVNKWIGAFLLFSVVQVLTFPEAAESTGIVQNIFMGALLYHFIVKYAEETRKYYWALFGILALNLVWCIFQVYGIDPIFRMYDFGIQQKITEPCAFFSLPAFLGNYAAVIAPLIMTLNPWLVLFVPFALYFAKSTFSVVAAVVAVLFYLWFKKRLAFWIVGAVLIVGAIFYAVKFDAPSGQFGKRFKIWQLVIQHGFQKQFFGYGVGSYGKHHNFVEMEPSGNVAHVTNKRELAYFIVTEPKLIADKELIKAVSQIDPNDYKEESFRKLLVPKGINFKAWDNPHNEFVKVFFDMGLAGIFIVGGYLFSLSRRFLLNYKWNPKLIPLAGAAIAIVIVSFGHFPFYVARLGAIFIAILALFETELIKAENA